MQSPYAVNVVEMCSWRPAELPSVTCSEKPE
jgi:hypothetical protein